MNPIVKNANKLRWKFENVKNLTDAGFYSGKFTIDTIDWKISTSTKTLDKTKYLAVFLHYDSDNKVQKNWICEADVNIKLYGKGGHGMAKHFAYCYVNGHENRGFANYIPWANLVSEDSGYLKGDSMNIEVEFNFRYYDFSKIIPNVTDITVNVEDTEFHLNKWALGSKSKHFYELILNTKLRDLKTVKLDGIKAEHFCYMLASFYPFFDGVNEQNYAKLIEMAAHFGVPSLHYKIEQYLIDDTKLELIDKIKMAGDNDYEELMKECLKSLDTGASIKELQAEQKFSELKDSTKFRILYRCLDFF